MKFAILAIIFAACSISSVVADVPACSQGGQVDGQNPIGPWENASDCEAKCYFEETDESSDNYQMQCKGVCAYAVPACGTSDGICSGWALERRENAGGTKGTEE
nr:hypothetical protein CFP56_12211 [Quercus suber]